MLEKQKIIKAYFLTCQLCYLIDFAILRINDDVKRLLCCEQQPVAMRMYKRISAGGKLWITFIIVNCTSQRKDNWLCLAKNCNMAAFSTCMLATVTWLYGYTRTSLFCVASMVRILLQGKKNWNQMYFSIFLLQRLLGH